VEFESGSVHWHLVPVYQRRVNNWWPVDRLIESLSINHWQCSAFAKRSLTRCWQGRCRRSCGYIVTSEATSPQAFAYMLSHRHRLICRHGAPAIRLAVCQGCVCKKVFMVSIWDVPGGASSNRKPRSILPFSNNETTVKCMQPINQQSTLTSCVKYWCQLRSVHVSWYVYEYFSINQQPSSTIRSSNHQPTISRSAISNRQLASAT
jgi:hypothetical protein